MNAPSEARASAAPGTPPPLEARGLTRRFEGRAALEDLSFRLERGEMLAMIGPNGAGKSTCFNLLGGQLRADAGEVRLEGRDVTGWSPRRLWRAGLGRAFQIAAIYPSMTVAENVQMALLAHHRRLGAMLPRARRLYREEALAVLARTGLADQADRHAAVLAYGDLKRLDLACALAHGPRVLLMDEPTAGMAPAERGALMALVSGIARTEGVSVLFTEHDMDVVFGHADRVMVLNRGRLIAEGPPEAIQANARVREVYLGGGAPVAATGGPADGAENGRVPDADG